MGMNSENELTKAIGGDQKSAAALILEYRWVIESVIRRYCDDVEERKDLAQNIAMKIIRNISRFTGSCSITTWIYRISMNQALDYLRQKIGKKHLFSDEALLADAQIDLNAVDIFGECMQGEMRRDLQQILDALPLDMRTAFSLFYFGDYRGNEIAEVLKITENNCFVKLKEARERVRSGLRKKGWFTV